MSQVKDYAPKPRAPRRTAKQKLDDARRVELCLNACAGIPDEVLEANFVSFIDGDVSLPDTRPLYEREDYVRGILHMTIAIASAMALGFLSAYVL